MDFKDKKVVAQLVSETIDTKGWEIIESFINGQIDTAKARLLTVDPSDVSQIASLQERYRSHKTLLNTVKTYIRGL